MNKSWQQHPTRHELYGHLPPITKTIQVRRTKHAGRCWRSRDELISDVLLWTLTYVRAKAGRPARTYIQLLCEESGCSAEDLPEVMNDREKWRERVRDIRCCGTTWYIYIYIYIYIYAKVSNKIRKAFLVRNCQNVCRTELLVTPIQNWINACNAFCPVSRIYIYIYIYIYIQRFVVKRVRYVGISFHWSFFYILKLFYFFHLLSELLLKNS